MTIKEAIEQLKFDQKMIRTDYGTGELIPLEEVKAWNKSNYEAYLADELAIEALEKQEEDVPRWIPVTERLPEEIGYYLIQCETKILSAEYGIHKARYLCGEGKWEAIEAHAFYENVLAWRELPKPYNPESN